MLSWLEKNEGISWFIVVLIALGIFYVSSLSFSSISYGSNVISTVYHVLAFFLLAFFLQIALVRGKNLNLIALAFFLAIVYGISDEFHQYFVPGRSTTLKDVLLDALGAVYSTMIYSIFILHRKRKRKSL